MDLCDLFCNCFAFFDDLCYTIGESRCFCPLQLEVARIFCKRKLKLVDKIAKIDYFRFIRKERMAMAFADRLQQLRHDHGLTQEAFAQQLQVSRQAVSKWESGKGYPEIEKILYICNCYGVRMDDLFEEELPDFSVPETAPEKASQTPMTVPPLNASLGSFFTNLSPYHQTMFGAAVALIAIVLLVLACITISKGESDQMIMKLIWTGLLVVFVIGEALSVGLTSIWFAAGSLVALICALLGANLWIQIVAFIAATILSLVAFRPVCKKYINGKVEPTNADRIIGSEVLVTEQIHNIQATGAVRVNGITWTARSENDAIIPEGTLVRIKRIEGAKVYVEQI